MGTTPGADAADWLGLPALPPAGLVERLGRVRQRAQRGVAAGPPFLVAMEHLLGIYDAVVLGLLCRNDIPEALAVGSADAAELARRLHGRRAADDDQAGSIDPDALHRILRFAAMRGFVDVDRRGRFRANRLTTSLTADHPASARPWVEFLTSPSTSRVFENADAALLGLDPCRKAHGADFFTHVNEQDPAAGEAFNGAMAQGSHIQSLLLADAIDLSDVHHLVDVGGGTGGLARTLLRLHPALEVTVLDLPSVVADGKADAATDPGAARWVDRCSWVGGDFFDAVPAGADAYTLLAILHDWSDTDAGRILATVRAAMGPGSRCYAVDATIDDRHPQSVVAATDIMMLMLTAGGRERTTDEWRALVRGAGLRIESHRLLATGFSVYELRRA